MDFDQLLRKYLTGSISDMELEQLQGLLERVPEYKTELRQILELRSLIHDDALSLMPPEDLADRTRYSVAQRFAALVPSDTLAAYGAETTDRSRRRRFIAPFRITAGVMVAASLATMVALTPTLLRSPESSSTATVSNGPTVAAAEPITPGSRTIASPIAEPPARHRISGSSRALSGRADVRHTVPAIPVPLVATEMASNDETVRQMTTEVEPSMDFRQQPTVAPVHTAPSPIVPQQDNLYSDLASLGGVTMIDSDEPTAGELRKFTFGVTLGSGNVSALASPTVLMQNSYYFSFNLTGKDRIGLEMGASTFHHPVAAASSAADPFAKPNAGSPADNDRTVSGSFDNPSSSAVHHTADSPEQQVTYGAVFYDRRYYTVSRSVDLCGRVAFGGADNAVLSSVRAYAAYSPSKNITLTMGVGGSALFNVGSRGEKSLNYGIYYGIETGF